MAKILLLSFIAIKMQSLTTPAIAKNRNIEGKVTAEFTITKDGEAININITSGNNALKGATKSAIEKVFLRSYRVS